MKCEHCGCKNTKENPVTKGYNPYSHELDDDNKKYWLCEKCLQELINDI